MHSGAIHAMDCVTEIRQRPQAVPELVIQALPIRSSHIVIRYNSLPNCVYLYRGVLGELLGVMGNQEVVGDI